ncbi:MAG: DNA recombination protein RmuC [Bacillota bacterium]|nr:DNA recombination protein RmuC [Bacillota bacterium]
MFTQVLFGSGGLVLGALITFAVMARKNADLRTRLELAEERHNQEQDYLKRVERQFEAAFHNLAQGILDDKTQAMINHNSKQMQNLLDPLREHLKDFQSKVEITHKESMNKISSLEQISISMSTEAQRLSSALKGDIKKQGEWGKIVLDRVLESSGLRKGLEFMHKETDGKQGHVIIILPENRHLIIDSSVSVLAYDQFLDSSTPEEQKQAEQTLVQNFRNHIDTLGAVRQHEKLDNESADFILMFIPVEPAYMLALQTDPELFQYAWQRKVIPITATTLMATLWIIANIWQQARQTANALEIAEKGGALYDQFVGFVSSLREVGHHLKLSQGAYNSALNRLKTGPGNLINRAEDLRSLGVGATKSLDPRLIFEAEQEEQTIQRHEE